jgi:hypothetical protein
MKIEIFEHELGKAPIKATYIDEHITLARTQKRNTGIEVVKNTHLMWRRGMAALFHANEIADFHSKKTRNQLIEDIIKRYPHIKTLKRHFKITHKYSISAERRKYNFGSIYSSQPPTFLLSLEYNWEHYPIVGGYENQFYKDYIYWEEVYTRACEYAVADPRFLEYEAIVEIRNRQIRGEEQWLKWVVPSDKDLQDISRELQLDIPDIFNSVTFAPGFTREETPKDFIPFSDYIERKKKGHNRSGQPVPVFGSEGSQVRTMSFGR